MDGKAYSVLAPHYEKLITSCDYEQWSQYVFDKVKRYAPSKVGCDCACGSGYFTRFFKKNGLDVYGVDCSEKMLLEANKLSLEQKIPVQYLLQDVKRFKSFKKLGFITVINDGLNYLCEKDFKSAIKAFYTSLQSGGVLIFDLSSEYKLKNVLGNNLYGEDTDDVTYLWFNTLLEDSVKMELTFFVKNGDTYIREDETHVQYIHKTQTILKILEEVGFEVVEVKGHLGEELKEDSHRINFVAKKK